MMKQKTTIKRSKIFSWFSTCLLLLAVFTQSQSGQAQGIQSINQQQGEKLSGDLKKEVRRSPGKRVKVILDPATTDASVISTLLRLRGGKRLKNFSHFSSQVVELPASIVEFIAAHPAIGHLSLDKELTSFGHVTQTTGADLAQAMAGSTSTYNGAGIGIAIIDSGIDTQHAAFAGRNVVSMDFTGTNQTSDSYGHGSHVAAIAAGLPNLNANAYVGVASQAPILNLKVLDAQGHGSVSNLISALDWVLTNRTTYNIRVVNMSLGTTAVDSYKVDPLCLAVRRLVDAGIVVVCAAGNEGKTSIGQKVFGQIHSPGNEPSAITVGATNTYGTDSRSDDTIASFSSRGPTRSYRTDSAGVKHYDNLIKPDLVAPGNRIIAAMARNNYLVTMHPNLDSQLSTDLTLKQMTMSGTSMAAPVVAGAAAILLQANPSLKPNMVKAILMYSA